MSECHFAANADGLVLSGDLVYANASAAYREGLRLFRGQAPRHLDLAAIASIDSAGVAVLLAWLAEGARQGLVPTVRGLPATAMSLARVGGVLALLVPSAG